MKYVKAITLLIVISIININDSGALGPEDTYMCSHNGETYYFGLNYVPGVQCPPFNHTSGVNSLNKVGHPQCIIQLEHGGM